MTSTASRTFGSRELWIRLAVTAAVVGLFAVIIFVLPRYRWAWRIVWRGDQVGTFLGAMWTTFWLSAVSIVGAVLLGVLGGLGRLSRKVVWNQLAAIYVEVIRGTPLLVQVLLGYFCFAELAGNILESAGVSAVLVEFVQDPYVVGVGVLSVFTGAYVTEIVRAAVESIDRGQTEAALSQGMTQAQVYRHVVFPQALRRMTPPLAGQFVSLVKDSSLLMLIPGVVELARSSSLIRSRTYKDYEVLLPLGLAYFVICFSLSRLARRLELRLAD
ncbi:MAG: amino acid ABC transporter permease [Planctomycetota bacterium]|nr:amino acid ABC transporter permease [Planctomycetota bacterium]